MVQAIRTIQFQKRMRVEWAGILGESSQGEVGLCILDHEERGGGNEGK